MENEVKINDHGKPVCPICNKEGREYGQGGSDCEHDWVWENGKLIAVAHR